MANLQAYQQASFRARTKLDFCIHLIAFFAVNLLLIAVNYETTPNYLWCKWVVLGWGTGLFCHWLAVFPGARFSFYLFLREYERVRHD